MITIYIDTALVVIIGYYKGCTKIFERIKMIIKDLVQTCGACPAQWEFRTFEDRPVYVRYRWGYLSIRIGGAGEDIDSAVAGEEIYGEHLAGEWDGVIEEEKIIEIVSGLSNKLPKEDG